VHDDLVAVLVDPGRVATEDHRQLVLLQPHPAQAEQIMMVERGRPHADHGPALRHLGVGPLPQLQPVQQVFLVEAHSRDSEHRYEVNGEAI